MNNKEAWDMMWARELRERENIANGREPNWTPPPTTWEYTKDYFTGVCDMVQEIFFMLFKIALVYIGAAAVFAGFIFLVVFIFELLSGAA